MAAQPTSQQIIEGQKQDWNRVAGGWEKWDRLFEAQMAFVNHRLVADARLHEGLRVLDLGSGTGYPALLGAQVVGQAGSVVGMDLAEQMLAAAERKAKRLGLTNVSFKTGDVTSLPFDANTFDAVTSRFCLMFLPEIPKAAAEPTPRMDAKTIAEANVARSFVIATFHHVGPMEGKVRPNIWP